MKVIRYEVCEERKRKRLSFKEKYAIFKEIEEDYKSIIKVMNSPDGPHDWKSSYGPDCYDMRIT